MQKLARSGLPEFPYALEQVAAGIVHLGLGGFHRAHMARYTHDLMVLQPDALGWGIAGAGLMPADEALIDILTEQEGLYTLVERDAHGDTATVIGAIVRAIYAGASSAELLRAIRDPAIRIVSLTVTENGYCLDRATKTLDFAHDLIRHDLAHPAEPRSAIGVIAEAYAGRRSSGLPAFTVLTCDNIQHNGNVVRAAVLAFAERRDPALAAWIVDNGRFPNTMVDRITPVPEPEQIAAFQRETGSPDRAPVFCETFRQWIIEDDFVGGRPAWEAVGAQFVPDVAPYEMMKLRLLNASHSAISGPGQLMGYTTIAETMADPLLRRFMSALMERETEPTLPPVPGVDLASYKASLIERFANPAIHDTVQRVNTDAPLNLMLDPLRDRLARGEPFPLLALAVASWLRRARGEDERGAPLTIRHPLADLLREKAIEGGPDPRPLLSIRNLFGDLGDDPNAVGEIGKWLASYYAVGSRRTLERAADELGF